MGLSLAQFGLFEILIDAKVAESKLALRLQQQFKSSDWKIVHQAPEERGLGRLSSEQFDASKKTLFITDFKGRFFKRCPGARPGLTCCNYFVLNLGLQCNFNCSYCYLQSFINSPTMKMYSNIDQALSELEEMGQSLGQSALRIGTGEVIDSLSLDQISLFSVELIQFFRRFPKWRLEFKTKSADVDQFIYKPHAGNVIVSWSINPQAVIEREEFGTAHLVQRLEAAQKCRDRGFQISFHIDPMIWFPEWQAHYADLVDKITDMFAPKDIPYLSVGALRFQPEQRIMMKERFGAASWINRAEVFPSDDGKLRYDHHLRTQMFRFLTDRFKDQNRDWNIFMCMESPENWLETRAELPKSDEGLRELFDHNVIRKFNSL